MASATGLSNEEMLALEDLLCANCIGTRYKLALWGTGTFFRRGEILWLITAAHILQEVPLKELAIPIAECGGRLFDRECRHRGSANIAPTSFKNAGLRSEGTRIVQTTT